MAPTRTHLAAIIRSWRSCVRRARLSRIDPITKHHHPSKKKAIQNALGQLGWHAKGKDVVALLADFGIEVSEGLVSRAQVESMKRSDEVRRHEKKLKLATRAYDGGSSAGIDKAAAWSSR
jgi:hypothetical protein